jgi:hypothetical protein
LAILKPHNTIANPDQRAYLIKNDLKRVPNPKILGRQKNCK